MDYYSIVQAIRIANVKQQPKKYFYHIINPYYTYRSFIPRGIPSAIACTKAVSTMPGWCDATHDHYWNNGGRKWLLKTTHTKSMKYTVYVSRWIGFPALQLQNTFFTVLHRYRTSFIWAIWMQVLPNLRSEKILSSPPQRTSLPCRLPILPLPDIYAARIKSGGNI